MTGLYDFTSLEKRTYELMFTSGCRTSRCQLNNVSKWFMWRTSSRNNQVVKVKMKGGALQEGMQVVLRSVQLDRKEYMQTDDAKP